MSDQDSKEDQGDLSQDFQTPQSLSGSPPASTTVPHARTFANPTPFIYPIRSLLSTMQPISLTDTEEHDSSSLADLAASLQREVASRRTAALGRGPSRNPVYANPSRGPGNASSPTPSSYAAFPEMSSFPLHFRPVDFVSLSEIESGLVSKAPDMNQVASSSTQIPSSPPADMKVRDFAADQATAASSSAPMGAGFAGNASAEDTGESPFTSLVRLPPTDSTEEASNDSQNATSYVTASQRLSSNSGSPARRPHREGPPVTVRFKYRVDEHGHHHVVEREGTLIRCEDEACYPPRHSCYY